MAVNINTQELLQVLESTPADQNIMLSGRHGIGKSQILTDYFTQKGMRITTLFLGQMSDPGDLIGLPNKDEKSGKTVFMPPYWFPMDGEPIVLFLDELNRARPEVLQTVMDLTLNRTLAGRRLPEGSRVISAVNDGEEYQLTDLDPALVSRFNVYNFHPTPQEWLLWASRNDIDSRIISFIQENPQSLDGSTDMKLDQGLEKTPDRRGWAKVSAIIHDIKEPNNVHKKIISGIIGMKTGAEFFNYFSTDRLVDARSLLTNYAKHKAAVKKYHLHELSILNESVCRFFESNDISTMNIETLSKNLADYVKGLDKEAMAHFVSLYESGNYPQTVLFILKHAKPLYVVIQTFVKML